MQFATERLPLAVYLHATDSLKLLDCKPVRPHKVVFVFDDPNDQAAKLTLEFERGNPVSAAAIFASQKYLRRLMTQQLEAQNIERYGF